MRKTKSIPKPPTDERDARTILMELQDGLLEVADFLKYAQKELKALKLHPDDYKHITGSRLAYIEEIMAFLEDFSVDFEDHKDQVEQLKDGVESYLKNGGGLDSSKDSLP